MIAVIPKGGSFKVNAKIEKITNFLKKHPNRFTTIAYLMMFVLPIMFQKILSEVLIWYLLVPFFILMFDLWIRKFQFRWSKIWEKVRKFSYIRATVYAIVLYFINIGVTYGETFFSGVRLNSKNTVSLMNTVGNVPLVFLYILVIAPIIEEFTFRESFFNGLTNKFEDLDYRPFTSRKLVIAISAWVVALMFALVHNDVHLISYEIVSLWLQFIYCHERKISYTICAHIGSNVITLLVLLLA